MDVLMLQQTIQLWILASTALVISTVIAFSIFHGE